MKKLQSYIIPAIKNIFKLILLTFILQILLVSCKSRVYDGPYCADVTYYNPTTGTMSEYTLYVVVENNVLREIKFPLGFLNEEEGHFANIKISPSGKAEFIRENGYQYKISIKGEISGCLDGVPRAVQCNGITQRGLRCRNLTDNFNGYCWQHQD